MGPQDKHPEAPPAATPPRKPWYVREGLRALRMLGVFCVLFAIVVWIMAPGVVFQPESCRGRAQATPAPPTGFEDVWLTAADGVRIHSWLGARPGAKLALLYLHGNAGNLEFRRGWVRALAELPADILALEYRGYGRSEGHPDEKGLYADAEAAYQYLVAERRIDPAGVVIYGKSLGGGPACELAARRPCGGLILQSTFTSVPDMASHLIPVFPAGWFVSAGFDNLSKVRTIAAPKLIIHSRGDEMIPCSMAERLFQASCEPRKLVIFESSRHNDLVMEQKDALLREFRQFLEGLEKTTTSPSLQ